MTNKIDLNKVREKLDEMTTIGVSELYLTLSALIYAIDPPKVEFDWKDVKPGMGFTDVRDKELLFYIGPCLGNPHLVVCDRTKKKRIRINHKKPDDPRTRTRQGDGMRGA